MAGPKQPINLVVANGKKHLTKSEISERQSSEVQPVTEGVAPPLFLTAKQAKEFDRLADMLLKLRIMGETDCDTLARYVIAQEKYTEAVKDLAELRKRRPKFNKGSDDMEVLAHLMDWTGMQDKIDKRIDRYFKQATAAASALGLTISSRCKLVAPVKEEAPKVNRFAKFGKAAGEE